MQQIPSKETSNVPLTLVEVKQDCLKKLFKLSKSHTAEKELQMKTSIV